MPFQPLNLMPRGRQPADLDTGRPDTIGETQTDDVQEVDFETSLLSMLDLWTKNVTLAESIVQDLQVSRYEFKPFMRLPDELRKTIFEYVLASGKPILPHLCDKEGKHEQPKFHDDNATGHASVFMLTGPTRVSKKLRKESLPVFYSTNTFAVGPDTLTYFAYLESVERLNWVLHVNLAIAVQSEKYAAWVLRCVNQFDEEVESHERNGLVLMRNARPKMRLWNDSTPATSTEAEADADGSDKLRRKPLTALDLTLHPRYLVGGFSDLSLAILLRTLSTALSPESKPKSRIVLPVSNASVFGIDSGLRWFPTVVKGLGMELRLVVRPDTATLDNRMIMLEWDRKFQGQNIVTVAGPEDEPGEEVMKRALEMFPGLEAMRRPRLSCYYRRSCHSPSITWYDMETMGGGRG